MELWAELFSDWVGILSFGVIAFVILIAFFFIVFFMVIRWTLPRFRYDQVMDLCWKIMLPLSIANILVTGLVLLIAGGKS